MHGHMFCLSVWQDGRVAFEGGNTLQGRLRLIDYSQSVRSLEGIGQKPDMLRHGNQEGHSWQCRQKDMQPCHGPAGNHVATQHKPAETMLGIMPRVRARTGPPLQHPRRWQHHLASELAHGPHPTAWDRAQRARAGSRPHPAGMLVSTLHTATVYPSARQRST